MIQNTLEVAVNPDPEPYTKHKFLYIKDHLGSTRAVLDKNGVVKESYDYYPFGLEMPGRSFIEGDIATREGFTGKERDAETNWHYFGARYYSAALGRWLAVDPLAEYPSGYVYVGNNPIINFDPDGRFLDTILDVGFIAYDVYDIASTSLSGENVSAMQWAALSADIAGLFIPFATGGGTGVRLSAKAITKADNGFRGLNQVGNIADLSQPERLVGNLLSHRGDEIIGLGDAGVRESLNLTSGKAADFLFVSGSGKFNITEVKASKGSAGTEISTALSQIKNTVEALRNKIPDAKIGTLAITVPKGANLKGNFTVSGNLLMRQTDEGSELVRIDGEAVHILNY